MILLLLLLLLLLMLLLFVGMHQMGALFTQMASLVAQQSDVLANIEDDVEIGLTNTLEAHASMTYLQEITKGNRSMILKIFALLVVFILLFLVWT